MFCLRQLCPHSTFHTRILITSFASTSNVSKEAFLPPSSYSKRPPVFLADGESYPTSDRWNVSPVVMRLMQRSLLRERNPLSLLKQRIVNHMHMTYRKPGSRSPLFTICENERRVVTVFENFDSLLTPMAHISRRPSDTYYVNDSHCLRAHTSAHQHKLLKEGLDNFLVIGDVYRRDEIDKTHYPCFHQVEGVRLYSSDELFESPASEQIAMLEKGQRTGGRQAEHTEEAVRVLELRLKSTLEGLCDVLFGSDCEKRWVPAYFPFTHPSYELEVKYEGRWLEVLGCGIMEQKLLASAGVHDKAGWAFGIGLERLAMVLYGIPDIRLFWSKDSGFLSQFEHLRPDDSAKYRSISAHPQVLFDISFYLPTGANFEDMKADVCDLIRTRGGEWIEQVKLSDEYENKKSGKKSQTYRIVYRSNEKALSKDEVNSVHKEIERELTERFGVEMR